MFLKYPPPRVSIFAKESRGVGKEDSPPLEYAIGLGIFELLWLNAWSINLVKIIQKSLFSQETPIFVKWVLLTALTDNVCSNRNCCSSSSSSELPFKEGPPNPNLRWNLKNLSRGLNLPNPGLNLKTFDTIISGTNHFKAAAYI